MSLTPTQPGWSRSPALRWGVALLGLAVLSLLDRPIWRTLTAANPDALRSADWWQWLRALGYLPTWVVAGLLLVLQDRAAGRAAPWRRGAAVLAGAALSGLGAEVLKAVIRRQRPGADGLYHFDWAGHGVPGLGIGTVSSHAAVAFGGAAVLSWLIPAWRAPLLALAAGCALTRLIAGAHFATDCYAAALVSYAVCGVLRRAWPGPHSP